MEHPVINRINDKGQPGVFQCPKCGAIGNIIELRHSVCDRRQVDEGPQGFDHQGGCVCDVHRDDPDNDTCAASCVQCGPRPEYIAPEDPATATPSV